MVSLYRGAMISVVISLNLFVGKIREGVTYLSIQRPLTFLASVCVIQCIGVSIKNKHAL